MKSKIATGATIFFAALLVNVLIAKMFLRVLEDSSALLCLYLIVTAALVADILKQMLNR